MIRLSNRLSAVASLIPQNSIAADIGTDHAYLPIWLIENNIASYVISTDIKEGPVVKAKQNIACCGLSEKIEVIKTDGLKGIEKFLPDVVIISGMGGETIRDIIKRAPFLMLLPPKKIRLVLQPMTRAPLLRRFLYDNGFDITVEKIAFDDRIYEIICSEYDGKNHFYSEADLLIGKKNIEERGPLLGRLIQRKLLALEFKIKGCQKASLDVSAETLLRAELMKLKESI